MSTGISLEEKVGDVLRDYVQHNRTHLITVERIYQNVTGDEADFSSYDEAEEAFFEIDWNEALFLDFVDHVKQVVEKGEMRKSETYFDITEPDSISTAQIEEELSDPQYNPDASGEERDGFEYRVGDDGKVRGRYVYTDVETNLTFDGDIQPSTSDGFIQFEIVPEENLLVVQSTSVIDVQKARKYFDRKTSIEFAPSADFTTHIDGSTERVNEFLSEFHDGIPSDGSDVPGLLQVDEIKLEDTSVDTDDDDDDDDDDDGEQLENIQFEGHNIKNDDEVQSYLGDDSPWVIKKLQAEVYFRGDRMKVTIGMTSMMSYAKVSETTDWDAITDLSEMAREWFLEDLRVRTI